MERLILALEIANDVYEITQTIKSKPEQNTALIPYQGINLDQIDLENYTQEPEKMNFLKRIKRGIEFLGDWFSDATDDTLITEYGFLKTFVEWE